jgi:phosphoserine phosphatase
MPLVAFDFDGTLSDDEMIVELGEQVGRGEEITAVTERAMEGELSYAQSLEKRVSMLEGPSVDEIAAAYERVALREGMTELLQELVDAGVKIAILTGGFESGIEHVLDRAGVTVDRIVSNRLIVDENGRLTGEVEGPLVEGTKDAALYTAADDLGVDRSDTIAVGDGANDIPMLDAAAVAIGYQPKESVVAHCDYVVDSTDELQTLFEELEILLSADER